jgi:hypothetical protein
MREYGRGEEKMLLTCETEREGVLPDLVGGWRERGFALLATREEGVYHRAVLYGRT